MITFSIDFSGTYLQWGVWLVGLGFLAYDVYLELRGKTTITNRIRRLIPKQWKWVMYVVPAAIYFTLFWWVSFPLALGFLGAWILGHLAL